MSVSLVPLRQWLRTQTLCALMLVSWLGHSSSGLAAEAIALSLELPAAPAAASVASDPAPSALPPEAAAAPLGHVDVVDPLPPPPPLVTAPAPLASPLGEPSHLPQPVLSQFVHTLSGILGFDLAPVAVRQPQVDAEGSPGPPPDAELHRLFAGGSESLVAIAVGSAEGTRTPDGAKTWAFAGHWDPGNGRWNLGTFSYQHGADSPEAADQAQLARLHHQAQELRAIAATHGLTLTPEELLNGIDLANQSPEAALSAGGYIDRLVDAHQQRLEGADAILWARTYAYLDPSTQQWNAPGLGNTTQGIVADQQRRMGAIAQTLASYPK
ncbi:MAG: hypothetical protein KME20_16075 [Kaiparowitsia implicata GSE-PSE-MK54-09C]|nr:hypothetical protein [Kaiparowitsia implicata GSE-PSE-MK54-09C]